MMDIKKMMVITSILLTAIGLLSSTASATSIILSPGQTLTPTPPPSDPEVNTIFDVNITIANVTNLYAWQIVIWFRNDVLQAVDAVEGPFLKQVGSTYWAFLPDNIINDYNDTHGYLFVGCSGTWDPSLGGANGTGVLCTIKFNGTNVGSSSLVIGSNPPYVTYLEDQNGGEISFEVVVTQVNVIPEFPVTIIAPIILLSTAFIILCKKKRLLNFKP
jgi:hypothetical protein